MSKDTIRILFLLVFIISLPVALFAADAPPEKFLPRESRAPRTITISEGIARVLKDNRLIKISLPDKDMAFEDTMIARSPLFPHLSAAISKTFYKDQVGAIFGGSSVNTLEKDFWSYNISVYQTLYDFGKSLANYRASLEALNASKENIESVRRVALLEFIAAYFDLLQTEKMIAVAEKETESLTAYLHDVEKLFAQGVVVKNDLLPAQVRLADAKQRLIAARNARDLAAASVNTILALPLTEEIKCCDISLHPPQLPAIEEAWKLALGQRSEIAFIDALAKAATLSEQANEKENLPTIFAQGDYSYTQNKYALHNTNALAQVGAKINLYEGGLEQANVTKQRARQNQLAQQKEKLIADIQFEIKASYTALENAGEKIQVASDARAQAEENVRASRAKYAAGVATTTDVLEAITLETGAQTNYFTADYEVKRAYSRLMYSMGIDLALVYERMERGQNERTN